MATDTWIEVPDGSDFGAANLPIGVVATASRGGRRRVATRVGDSVIPLGDVFVGATFAATFEQPTANAFLGLGPLRWTEVRDRLQTFVSDRRHARPLLSVDEVTVHLPVRVGDYVDFYSSLDHASRVGRLFRPDAEPLLPNWRHLPVGYHGRAGTIVTSGTAVTRPIGLVAADPGARAARCDEGATRAGDAADLRHSPFPRRSGVERAPTAQLDFETEVGFVVGTGNRMGEPVPPELADRHVFGAVLVNDWSARDIQSFEYQPLGPFLGKSFATTISPWIVPLAALAPHRATAPVQDPPPDPGLANPSRHGFDVTVRASIGDTVVGETSMRHLYWTHDQQYAHLTSNGAVTRPGDLFATGTISGPGDDECGCLLEATARGERPIRLDDGRERAWLADGDTVTLRAWAGRGSDRIGFGDCTGTVGASAHAESDTSRAMAAGGGGR